MDSLAAQYPTKVQVIVAGKSYEGRDIKGVKVSLKSGNKAVFVEGGKYSLIVNIKYRISNNLYNMV